MRMNTNKAFYMLSCIRFTNTATVPELKSWLTCATVATNRVKTVLIARIGLLAFVHIWARKKATVK